MLIIVVNLFCERQVQAFKLRDIQTLHDINITQWSRTIVLVILAYILNKSNTNYIDYEKTNSVLLNKVISECVDSTPTWFRKYRDDDSNVLCNAPAKKKLYITKPTAL